MDLQEFWIEISASQQPYQVIHIQMLEKRGSCSSNNVILQISFFFLKQDSISQCLSPLVHTI